MITISEVTCINEKGARNNLEDSVYPPPGSATTADKLFLVCDGVGGESKGEVASRIVCEQFPLYFDLFPAGEAIDDDYIQNGQRHVLKKMQDYAESDPFAASMSTTLTLCFITGNSVFIAWCGDSRIYHIRNGEVIRQSEDHSLVGALIRQGEITEEEARNHPQRNVILRCLSASGSPAKIDTHWIKNVEAGDYLMLCTDGLLEQIGPNEIFQILNDTQTEKSELFMNYCDGKTSDNFSLYLLRLNVV